MKKLLFIILSFFIFGFGLAQSLERKVVASSGNFSSNGSLSISSTFGESFVTTSSTSSLTLTQGFQQPTTSGGGGGGGGNAVSDLLDTDFNVYPNPFNHSFEIKFEKANNYNYEMIDVIGQKVEIAPIRIENVVHFDMNKSSSGLYFLKIINENGVPIETIKLDKI